MTALESNDHRPVMAAWRPSVCDPGLHHVGLQARLICLSSLIAC